MRRLFLALTADLDDSRELDPEDRKRTQQLLRRFLSHRSPARSTAFIGPELVAGDRVQMLVPLASRQTEQGRAAARAITQTVAGCAAAMVRSEVEGLSLSFGLGVGELHTELDPESIGRNDGPCFHHAEDALLQGAKKKGLWFSTAGWLPTATDQNHAGADALALIGVFQALCSQIYSWTPRQAELMDTSLPEGFLARDGEQLAPVLPRTEVAKHHGVNVPTVSKSLRAAELETVRHTAFAAFWSLASICDRHSAL